MKNYSVTKMGAMNGITLVFFGTLPGLFLQYFTNQLTMNAQSAWLALLMNSVFAFLMILFFLLLIKKRVGRDLESICATLVGERGARVILLFYFLIFFAYSALLLCNFAETIKLTGLHDANYKMIVLICGIVVLIAAYFGIEVIVRAGFYIMAVNVGGSVLVVTLLYPFFQVYELFPLLGNGFKPLMVSSLKGAGYNLLAMSVIILAPSFQNVRTVQVSLLWGLGGSAALKLMDSFALLLTHGAEVGTEKTLPFFEIARLVFINPYLQRIEAPLIIMWVMMAILTMAIPMYLATYLIARILRLTTTRPLAPLLAVAAVAISLLPDNFDQVTKWEAVLADATVAGIYFVPAILFVVYSIKGKNSQCPPKQV